MESYFKQKQEEALKEKNAWNYYCFCMHLVEKPEDTSLFKQGFEEVHGFEIEENELERILKW